MLSNDRTCLCDDFSDLFEIGTSTKVTSRKKVFNQSCPDIISHFLKLFVDLGIILVILNKLHDKSAICQGKELCILE